MNSQTYRSGVEICPVPESEPFCSPYQHFWSVLKPPNVWRNQNDLLESGDCDDCWDQNGERKSLDMSKNARGNLKYYHVLQAY